MIAKATKLNFGFVSIDKKKDVVRATSFFVPVF